MNDLEDLNDIKPCDGKLSFVDKKTASANAVVIKYQRGIKLKAYKCTHCSLWHLSSSAE